MEIEMQKNTVEDILGSWGKNPPKDNFFEKKNLGFQRDGAWNQMSGVTMCAQYDKLNPELLVIMDFFYISSQKVSSTPYLFQNNGVGLMRK